MATIVIKALEEARKREVTSAQEPLNRRFHRPRKERGRAVLLTVADYDRVRELAALRGQSIRVVVGRIIGAYFDDIMRRELEEGEE